MGKPFHFREGTIHLPPDRIPDPSDIIREERFPNPVDERHLGGPDREPPRNNPQGYRDWKDAQRASDVSNSSCMWDDRTWDKASHWGGDGHPDGHPLIRDTSRGYNSRCASENIGEKQSGGKDTSEGGGGTRETAEEPKPVEEDAGKPDASRGNEEGDEPDELTSPVAQEAVTGTLNTVTSPVIEQAGERISRDGSRGGSSGSSASPGLSRSGTNTRRGLPHAREHRFGPRHENRPDVTGGPVSSGVTVNPMSRAASPTPDGETDPPPGPQYSPVASASAVDGDGTMANPMGYAESPAIGTDGKDPGPPPGPEF
ncbi:MAG: hypothetical protein RDU20_10665 [Desulfomonilaceae bacterium]|nr:hypothetical protein [Desulfomonilaceae bacterium]